MKNVQWRIKRQARSDVKGSGLYPNPVNVGKVGESWHFRREMATPPQASASVVTNATVKLFSSQEQHLRIRTCHLGRFSPSFTVPFIDSLMRMRWECSSRAERNCHPPRSPTGKRYAVTLVSAGLIGWRGQERWGAQYRSSKWTAGSGYLGAGHRWCLHLRYEGDAMSE